MDYALGIVSGLLIARGCWLIMSIRKINKQLKELDIKEMRYRYKETNAIEGIYQKCWIEQDQQCWKTAFKDGIPPLPVNGWQNYET